MINASAAFLTANAELKKKPNFVLQIEDYPRVFTNRYDPALVVPDGNWFSTPALQIDGVVTHTSGVSNPILYHDDVPYICVISYGESPATIYCVSRETNQIINSGNPCIDTPGFGSGDQLGGNAWMDSDGLIYTDHGTGHGYDFQPFTCIDPVTMTEVVTYGSTGLFYGTDRIEIPHQIRTFTKDDVKYVVNYGYVHGIAVMRADDLVPIAFSDDHGSGSTASGAIIIDKDGYPWILAYNDGLGGMNLRRIDIYGSTSVDPFWPPRLLYDNTDDYDLSATINGFGADKKMWYDESDDAVIILIDGELTKVSIATGSEGTILSQFTLGVYGDYFGRNTSFQYQGLADNGDFFVFGRADTGDPNPSFTRFNSQYIDDGTTLAHSQSYYIPTWITPDNSVNRLNEGAFDRSDNTMWVAMNLGLYRLDLDLVDVQHTTYPWIVSMEPQSTEVDELEGGANLGQLAITVLDVEQQITADFPTITFEGKRCRLLTGFYGMDFDDYVTVFTGAVDVVPSANKNAAYTFVCVDNKQLLSKVIYTVADDGMPTDDDHRRTLNAHPIDIALDILTSEVGYSSDEIDTATFEEYRDTVFAGAQMQFSIDSPPAAREFIEKQLMKPLGAYIWVNNLGLITIGAMYPLSTASVMDVDELNIVEIPEAEQIELLNTINFRFDKDTDNNFLAESVLQDSVSVARFGQFGQHVMESDGARSSLQGFFMAAFTAQMIFLRYGRKNLKFSELQLLWDGVVLEPGDIIRVTCEHVPDRVAGVMGITNNKFIVLDRIWDWESCTVSLLVIDGSFLDTFGNYKISPTPTDDYASASPTEQANYMFLCSDDDDYTNSDDGHALA